jgi:hypothetical protein
VRTKLRVNCSDLYDNASEKLKRLDNDIDRTIQDLAKEVEARGVPKDKVARQLVRELTARGVLSKSRIYEGLGIEYKRKFKKKVTEETFPRAEIAKEESSQVVLSAASGTGQSYALEDMNGGPDNNLVYGEQKKKVSPRHEDERLNEKEQELIKEIAYSRGKIAKLKSIIEKLEKQLAEKEADN